MGAGLTWMANSKVERVSVFGSEGKAGVVLALYVVEGSRRPSGQTMKAYAEWDLQTQDWRGP